MKKLDKRKVLVVTDIFTPYKEPLMIELSKRCDLTVYYTTLISPDRNWDVKFSNQYKYEILPGFNIHFSKYNLFFNPSIIYKIINNNFDYIVIGGYSYPTAHMALFASMFTRAKRIFWTGGVKKKENFLQKSLLKYFKYFFVRSFHNYITYSSFSKQYLIDVYNIKANLITVAVQTVDIDFFYNPEKKYNKTITRIVFAGKLEQFKGIMDLIQAVYKINNPNIFLDIAGTGSLEKEINDFIANNCITNIKLLGYLQQHELYELYDKSDIFVLPSYREQTGNVLNEAMASGLPTISTNIIGTDVVDEGETGFIFTPGDIDTLVSYIKKLYDKSLLQEMGLNAQQRIIEKFSIKNQADGFCRVLR